MSVFQSNICHVFTHFTLCTLFAGESLLLGLINVKYLSCILTSVQYKPSLENDF